MRRYKSMTKLLRIGGVLCVGLFFVADVILAQTPGGGGRGDFPREGREGRGPGGRGGFSGRGFFGGGEPSLSRELRREEFAGKVALTEEQKQLLSELDMQRSEFFRSLPRGGGGPGSEDFEKRMQDMQAKMKEFDAKAVEVLTPAQKAVWEERKAEIKTEQEGGRPDAGRTPGAETPSTPTLPQAAPRRTVFSDDKPPEGTLPTASFGARATASGSAETDSDAVETGNGDSKPVKVGEPTLSFNFRYAPWADVLKLFAEAANLTLDLNDVPPGTFNYFDDKSYTITEALDVLNGYLLPKGYVLIRRDRFLVSLNIDNGIPPSLLPTITVDELSSRGANELLIVDVPLEGFEVDKVVNEVKELVGPWGRVAAMKNTNSLNITDTGSNITRIIRLLKAGAPIGDTAFRAITLNHISAAEAERTVRRLFGLNPAVTGSTQPQFGMSPFGGGVPQFGGFSGFRGSDRGSDRGRDRGEDRGRGGSEFFRPQPAAPSTPSPFAGKIQVTADTRTNHLLVTASASMVKVVEDVVKSIDVDTGEATVETGPVFLKSYAIPGGDVAQIAMTLDMVMTPGLVVGQDVRSSRLHVQATAAEHTQIEKLIQTMAGEPSGSVAVINLTRTDPVQVTNTLRNMFATDVKPPTIEADALGRRLLIRGSAEQLAQVKRLLQDLGEAGIDGPGGTAKVDRGPVRTLNLGAHDPQDILPLMRQMWEAADRNPIRVVVPSQPNPIRGRRVPGLPGFDPDEPASSDRRDDRPAEETRPTSRRVTPPAPSGPSTQTLRRPSILQVSQSGEGRDPETRPGFLGTSQTATSDDDRPSVNESQTDSTLEPRDEPATETSAAKPASDKSPISMSIVGGQLVISSESTEALDELEDMVNSLVSALPSRTRWTVFYLRTADATETAQMLERLFPQSSVTASTAGSSGMFGQFTSGLSSLGRGMMSSTGLNQTLGGSNDLRIITDVRANALFVTGPQSQIAEVEMMLELLDASELPGSLRDRIPRTISIEHADVDEVAEIVEDVFKDSMTPENAQGPQGGGGQRFNPLAMLMGGAGGGGAGRQEPGVQLTVGVDRRTSHLIVVCNDSLFRQIEGLVTSIDERARDARQTVRIMHLETADPALVSATLTSLIPKVTISASQGGNRRKPGEQTPGQPPGGAPGADAGRDAARDAELFRRTMQNRAQGGSTRPSFGSGGTRSNFGGRGTTGGGRSSSDRGSFGGRGTGGGGGDSRRGGR